MRTFKIICALALVLVSSAIAVATASAAETLWRWLPGSAKETFTGKSGEAILEGGAGSKIICTSSTVLLTGSTLTENEAKLGTAAIHFVGCKVEKLLPVNSVGDAKEVILTTLKLHNCLIKKGDEGIIFTPETVHLEVPAVALTIEVTGSFIGLVTPLETPKGKHFELNIKQAKGKQEIEKCEGGVAMSLKSKTDANAVELAGEEAKEGLLLFDGTIDKAGEELMEN
jgi:hypothetical protein